MHYNPNVFRYERLKRFVGIPSVLVSVLVGCFIGGMIVMHLFHAPLVRALKYVLQVFRSYFRARRGDGAWKLTVEVEEPVVLSEPSENETESSDVVRLVFVFITIRLPQIDIKSPPITNRPDYVLQYI